MSVRRLLAVLAALSMAISMVPAAGATGGYLTPKAPYITLDPGVPAGSSVKAIISTGEIVDGVKFQGIPDGIGLAPNDDDSVDVYVAHEQTTIPFFGTADFENASVAKLTLSTSPGSMEGAVEAASVAISPDLGYLRFCSASMAGPAEGFKDYVFWTGEEANDIVPRLPGQPYPADRSLNPDRQAGYAVALNTRTGRSVNVPGMGRLNHENTIALPGYEKIVMLTTDDTFSGPSAQLYMYQSNSQRNVFADRGSLWAFRVTRTDEGRIVAGDPFNGANDYLDIRPGDDWQGEFIRVPRNIALGTTAEAPQDALENWSNDNNVFQFIRLEDLAYDVNDPSVVYIADTGRSRVVPDPATGRLVRGPSGTTGLADNGAVFKMVFDENNPRKVVSFSMMAQGDDAGAGAFVPFVSPDNMDTSANSLMVQEDADNAKIWQLDLSSGAWSVVATVNDPDGESSGIVDASYWFGPGAWLLDVQAHGTFLETELQPDGTLLKLEDGQLMLMKIPGS